MNSAPSHKVRVAALQFDVTEDGDAMLETCLRMIDAVSIFKPALVVLPDCSDPLASYRDPERAYQVAGERKGPLVQAITAKAAEHHCYIKFTLTLRRIDGKLTGASLLCDPQGEVAVAGDKQMLVGNGASLLESARELPPVVETAAGRVGIYDGVEGRSLETARSLALGGAQILTQSLSPFAACEGSFDIPARAAENGVFIIAANQVAPIVPPEVMQEIADRLGIPIERLHDAGETQIVAPDGSVLAKAPREGLAVIAVDIDLAQVGNKRRPDDTDVLANRQPEL